MTRPTTIPRGAKLDEPPEVITRAPTRTSPKREFWSMNSTVGAEPIPRPRNIPVSAAGKLSMLIVVVGPDGTVPGAIVTMTPVVVGANAPKSTPDKSIGGPVLLVVKLVAALPGSTKTGVPGTVVLGPLGLGVLVLVVDVVVLVVVVLVVVVLVVVLVVVVAGTTSG